MKKIMCLILTLVPSASFAAGYTGWVTPTQIEWVANGMLVTGAFGDINSCGQANFIFIKPSPLDPDHFKTMASMILMAFTAQKEVQFYTNECVEVGFHWTGDVINAAYDGGFFVR